MPFDPLTAISSVDGRYRDVSAALLEYFSECALMRKRITVECKYLMHSRNVGSGIRALTTEEKKSLRELSSLDRGSGNYQENREGRPPAQAGQAGYEEIQDESRCKGD